MVGVSVAVESKKISEASKRDGAALKSLSVLTALFFPATFIAVHRASFIIADPQLMLVV
jgi:hypothetical protein